MQSLHDEYINEIQQLKEQIVLSSGENQQLQESYQRERELLQEKNADLQKQVDSERKNLLTK